jgi:hypothetical protein
MFHAYVERFDVIGGRRNILGWDGEMNKARVIEAVGAEKDGAVGVSGDVEDGGPSGWSAAWRMGASEYSASRSVAPYNWMEWGKVMLLGLCTAQNHHKWTKGMFGSLPLLRIWLLETGWAPNMLVFASFCQILKNQEVF